MIRSGRTLAVLVFLGGCIEPAPHVLVTVADDDHVAASATDLAFYYEDDGDLTIVPLGGKTLPVTIVFVSNYQERVLLHLYGSNADGIAIARGAAELVFDLGATGTARVDLTALCGSPDADGKTCAMEGGGRGVCVRTACVEQVPCGNGELDAGEDCDAGRKDSPTCDFAAGQGSQACTRAKCSDDYRNTAAQEACDGKDLGGETCWSLTGLADGILGCQVDCSAFDTSDCHTCGNGTQEGPEACDTGGDSPTCYADCTRKAMMISAGFDHTCALLGTGAIKCWGTEVVGELGDGGSPATQKSPPVDVSGIDGVAASAVAIDAGYGHTCAVLDTGAVECWGLDSQGQLGNGSPKEFTTDPTDVLVLTGGSTSASVVSAGELHTCAVLTTGALMCWGDDREGQAGLDWVPLSSTVPKQVYGIDGIAASATTVATGWTHTCAVLTTGAVRCWGANLYGEIGNGQTTNQEVLPVVVAGIDGSSNVAIGVTAGKSHTCALLNSGQAMCWGSNGKGQLGDGGTNSTESTPIIVEGL